MPSLRSSARSFCSRSPDPIVCHPGQPIGVVASNRLEDQARVPAVALQGLQAATNSGLRSPANSLDTSPQHSPSGGLLSLQALAIDAGDRVVAEARAMVIN